MVVVLVDVLEVVDVEVEVELDDAAGSASPMSLLHAATVPTRNATATRRRANEAGRAGGVRVTPTSLTDRAAQLKSWCEAVTMLEPIRHARRADVTAMIAIAEEGDAPGVDEGYLDFVAAQGRLMVCGAHDDGEVLGFAGSIPVGGAAMVTDLFVSAHQRGTGRAAPRTQPHEPSMRVPASNRAGPCWCCRDRPPAGAHRWRWEPGATIATIWWRTSRRRAPRWVPIMSCSALPDRANRTACCGW